MHGNILIPLGLIAAFFAAVLVVLYSTNKASTGFTDYAVGGRSYGSWFIAMSYTNSWWPGATFTAFFGLSAGAGVFGFYALAYSLIGVTAMYLMAERAWRWGSKYNLHTQPDLLGLRFDSTMVKKVASAIGIVSVFPWVVLGMQAMAALFRFASFNRWSVTTCLLLGLALIVIRQFWTVRMGMRGLIMTDVFQGFVAYVVAAVVCAAVLFGSTAGWGNLSQIPDEMLHLPGDGGPYGSWYVFSAIFTGIIGSMCWPMSFQRIYTARGVHSVKKGTLQTILLAGGFYILLTLLALAAAGHPEVAASPQDGWFTLLYSIGGPWFLGLAIVIVLAASMGHVDGCVQVCGTQFANDLMVGRRPRSDKQLTLYAKSAMAVYMLLAALVAYLTFDFSRLQSLAMISYQGIVQLAVPLFLGLFWKGGNKQGALAGMLVGFTVAVALEVTYPDHIPALGSLTSGVVALGVNLIVFLACHWIFPQDTRERGRVAELFASATAPRRAGARPAASELVTD